jgi:hypothetical protein
MEHMGKQMELFSEGGLRDEGGETEPKSGNKVPSGSLKEEVADDIPVMISEGEFVFPADVVRYIGLNTLMKMRQDAKQGLKMMEKMGQMGNSEEAEIPDDIPFGMADLIVVSGEMKKEDKEKKAEGGVIGLANGGSLFDDPRFQRPKGGGTPVLDDEEKKEIEDALIGTVYGNITVRRYVNADGVVKYIPFIDDEPQMPIPEGFELDNTAPEPKSNVVTSTGDTDRGEDSGGATFTPDVGSPFDDQGAASFNINNLNNKELVEYYGSFSSPMNRFLTVGVGALFGGVPALGIAAMQQLAQTRGPNSLVAVENLIAQKISNGEISGDLLDRLKELQKRAKQKGTGPRGFLASLIGKVSGGDETKKTNLENAIARGDVSGVSKELDTPEVSTGQMLTEVTLPDLSAFKNDVDPQEEGAEFIPAPLYTTTTTKYPETRPQTLGVPISPEQQERFQTQREARAMVDNINRKTVRPEFALDMTELRKGAEALIARDKEEDLYQRGFTPEDMGIDTADRSLYGRGFTPEEIGTDPALDETKKRTRRVDQPRTGILPRRGERFPDVGLDRPSRLGQTRVDDFLLGVQRDDKGDVANLSEQQQKNIRQNVQEQENIRQKLDQEDRERQSRGFGPMSVQERFDRQQQEFTGFDSSGNFVGFYVGGVPTKPMKPQRLKKGGLAKPKVKPKRMKKGGLASKKK